ncbi:uncharacterized protein TRAVEDRAFT_45559 [Trametes versicolor FP-101664 SS1]|uniref:uncharacterized protein n=1 Tax=Trametes versicolor (strain FP-101664) TaxID=717944 RepID=UPI0004624829|nr:uncharacterized protein TRAVEDRAFT_45559 [Trametes versicolor FP-101664 SS1]EIW60311.1 hypothetical protein TRAVEDRAFT_45559 [Trametes versicolor FP-101664 SS1]
MDSTNPRAQDTSATSETPSTSESSPALDGRYKNLVALSLFGTLIFFAIGVAALQNAFLALIAHLILAHCAVPPINGPFAAASLKATFVLSLINTPFVLLPEFLHTAYALLQTGFNLESFRTRRAACGNRRPSTGRLNAQRAMRHVLMASSGPVGSLVYRALWCSPEGCAALDPLHAAVAAIAGRVLLWGYLFVRKCFAEDVSEELESLRQEQLNVERDGLDKQSARAKDVMLACRIKEDDLTNPNTMQLEPTSSTACLLGAVQRLRGDYTDPPGSHELDLE